MPVKHWQAWGIDFPSKKPFAAFVLTLQPNYLHIYQKNTKPEHIHLQSIVMKNPEDEKFLEGNFFLSIILGGSFQFKSYFLKNQFCILLLQFFKNSVVAFFKTAFQDMILLVL